MEAPKVFSDDEKKELLLIINTIKGAGIKLNKVAEETGINYKAFMNKVKDLEIQQRGEKSEMRNNFTRKDYEAVTEWWAEYKARILR